MTRMMILCRSAFVLSALMAAGCISAPRATIELSEIVGQQIADIQKAHEAVIGLYYSRSHEAVERFLEDTWIPTFLGKVVQRDDVKAELQKVGERFNIDPQAITSKIEAATTLSDLEKATIIEAFEQVEKTGAQQFGQLMLEISEAALKQINIQRADMIGLIDAQEAKVLEAVRSAYTDLYSAQSTIDGYLRSVVEVKAEQDLILDKLGVLEDRDDLLGFLFKANEAAVKGLNLTDSADSAITNFKKDISAALPTPTPAPN